MNPRDSAVATTKLKIMTLQTEIFFENVTIPIFQGLYMTQSVPWLQDVSLQLCINYV
jgi:hypothetical protein